MAPNNNEKGKGKGKERAVEDQEDDQMTTEEVRQPNIVADSTEEGGEAIPRPDDNQHAVNTEASSSTIESEQTHPQGHQNPLPRNLVGLLEDFHQNNGVGTVPPIGHLSPCTTLTTTDPTHANVRAVSWCTKENGMTRHLDVFEWKVRAGKNGKAYWLVVVNGAGVKGPTAVKYKKNVRNENYYDMWTGSKGLRGDVVFKKPISQPMAVPRKRKRVDAAQAVDVKKMARRALNQLAPAVPSLPQAQSPVQSPVNPPVQSPVHSPEQPTPVDPTLDAMATVMQLTGQFQPSQQQILSEEQRAFVQFNFLATPFAGSPQIGLRGVPDLNNLLQRAEENCPRPDRRFPNAYGYSTRSFFGTIQGSDISIMLNSEHNWLLLQNEIANELARLPKDALVTVIVGTLWDFNKGGSGQ